MQAGTGAGVVNIGATSIDYDTGTDYVGELDITDDKNIIELLRLSDVGRILRTFKIKKNVEVTDNGKDDF